VAPGPGVGASAQLVSPGEQNLLSARHEDPLMTLWPIVANVQRTVSPTLMATGLGAKVFWPFGPTVISTVCAGWRNAVLIRPCEAPRVRGLVNLPVQFSTQTVGEPRSDRPSSQ